jgi:hypothetical protein
MTMEWVDKMARDLEVFSIDLGAIQQDEAKKAGAKEGEGKEKGSDGPNFKSLQKLTTFYGSKEEAKEAEKTAKDHPIAGFIEKRMKEIFGG